MHLTRTGPPEAAGRWSLVPSGAGSTERAHALAVALLERHGVVTRESVLGEGVPGGFAAVYPVLRAMEEAGKIRRGYFIEGLGAAQFALPGAVDRLRAERSASDAPLLRCCWPPPTRPTRTAPRCPGRRRSCSASAARTSSWSTANRRLYVERSGKGLVTLPAFEQLRPRSRWARLRSLAENSSRREFSIERVDGEAVLNSPVRSVLEQAGFQREYLGLTLRLPALAHPQARSA